MQGCYSRTDVSSVTPDSNSQINMDDGQINITGKDGEKLSINNKKLPENFPSDIPLYPEAEILYGMSYSEKNVSAISLGTSDSISSIGKYYEKELEARGWKIEQIFNTDRSCMFTAGKDKKNLSVTITTGSDSGNNIALSVSYSE